MNMLKKVTDAIAGEVEAMANEFDEDRHNLCQQWVEFQVATPAPGKINDTLVPVDFYERLASAALAVVMEEMEEHESPDIEHADLVVLTLPQLTEVEWFYSNDQDVYYCPVCEAMAVMGDDGELVVKREHNDYCWLNEKIMGAAGVIKASIGIPELMAPSEIPMFYKNACDEV